jgi:hypothetical protein
VHLEKAWAQSFAIKSVLPPSIAKVSQKKAAFNDEVDRLAAAIKLAQTMASGQKLEAAKNALDRARKSRAKIATAGQGEGKKK